MHEPDLRVYSSDMELIGFVSGITSLQWHRKFNEPGEFELHVALTEEATSYLQMENLLWIPGKSEAGVIEFREPERDADSSDFTVKGRFLSSYLDRRLIRPYYSIDNGLVETAMREIFSNAVALPRVTLGPELGITDKVTFQATYKNLLTWEEKLAQYADIGFRFRPDFDAKTITFELYKGVDRSTSQTDRAQVIFSEEYGNILKADYEEDSTTYKNVCYVGGQGEGTARTFVTVGDDTLTGLKRREMLLDATDVEKANLTDAQYQAALKQRGVDKLKSEACMTDSLDAEIEPTSNYTYPDDYNLGDIVTISIPSWGVSVDRRITEINEIYENGAYKIEPTFGTRATISFSDN